MKTEEKTELILTQQNERIERLIENIKNGQITNQQIIRDLVDSITVNKKVIDLNK